nr:UDP-N-acetylglucosamine 2-epimerase [Butyrivibrio sp. WCD3002]
MKKREGLETILMSTGQHKEMLYQVCEAFGIKPDYDLEIMKEKQDLFDITTSILSKAKDFLNEVKPDLVLVHGDTTSTFVMALACFYLQIPVGHVEAGLRTYNIYEYGTVYSEFFVNICLRLLTNDLNYTLET